MDTSVSGEGGGDEKAMVLQETKSNEEPLIGAR